jgi:hypothetical protein
LKKTSAAVNQCRTRCGTENELGVCTEYIPFHFEWVALGTRHESSFQLAIRAGLQFGYFAYSVQLFLFFAPPWRQ